MRTIKFIALLSLTHVMVACVSTGSPLSSADCTNESNPFVGRYGGKEVLEGGTFPIKIRIDCTGKVKVIDVDGRVAMGDLEGDRFVAKRGGNAPQVFTGEVSDRQITGTTKDNPFLGSGTFSATKHP